jgi:hypothetical protein
VDWSLPVHIHVQAAYGTETRTVEGAFIGAPRRDPYRELITSSNWILYGDNNQGQGVPPFANRVQTTTLNGHVWQDSTVAPDVSWQSVVNWPSGGPVVRNPAPTPQATQFINDHLPQAVGLAFVDTTVAPLVINLNGDPTGSTPTFFVGPSSTAAARISNLALGAAFPLYDIVQTTINVRGVCVWLFPKGVRFDLPVEVKAGGPNAVLVIVAGANGRYFDQFGEDFRDRAIWYFGSVDMQPNVTVYLVTDAVTDIEDFSGLNPSCTMNNLGIFTHGLWFLGPAPPRSWTMQYSSGMDALAQQLESMGALPASGGLPNSAFTLVPGSWREP